MTRTAFLAALEQLLAPLPESERKDALRYYEEYLDAAGPENAARAIAEQGSPEEVARKILCRPGIPCPQAAFPLAHGAGRRTGGAGAGVLLLPAFQGHPGAAGGARFFFLRISCFLCGSACRKFLYAARRSRFHSRRLDFLPLC